jgi:integrase
MELIKKDPTEIAYGKKDKKTIEQLEEGVRKYIEEKQIAQFLHTDKEHGLELDFLIFLVLSYTGMRVGELVALNWKDVDFVNHTNSKTKTYYNPKNNTLKYQLDSPKTKKKTR